MSMKTLLILAQPSKLMFGTVTIWYVREQKLVLKESVQKLSASQVLLYTAPSVKDALCGDDHTNIAESPVFPAQDTK